MRPVEVTRSSIGNWSDTEQAALAVAIKQSAEACAVRSGATYTGATLIDYARLCALGQAWPSVIKATGLYLSEESGPKPQLADAYAARINAELHLKDEQAALIDTQAMLAAVPYTSTSADASSLAIDYMELLYTSDAILIASARQKPLLAQLRVRPGESDGLTLSDLYRNGLVLASLQQLANEPDAAAISLAALEAALPVTLPPDDAIRIAAARHRYAQIGQPLQKFTILASLRRPFAIPRLPARGAMTALLLFPDWCAQCVALARKLPESVFSVSGHEAYAWGLLAQTISTARRSTARSATLAQTAFDPALAAEYLNESPTVTVLPTLLEQFDASEVPLLILTDALGIIRLIQPVDEAALDPGKTLDSAIALVGRTWPAVKPTTGPPAAR